MADVAVIYHWQRDSLDALSIQELMAERERAVDRAELLGLLKRA